MRDVNPKETTLKENFIINLFENIVCRAITLLYYKRNRKRVACVYGVIMHAGNVRRIREKRVNTRRSLVFCTFLEYSPDISQDACRGVHSACRREVNRHKLDICVLRLRQRSDPGIFVCRSKFSGLKVGRGS